MTQGNNLGSGGGSPPASQLAVLFWDSWYHGKLRRTKVYQFRKQQTNNNKPENPERAPKNK